MDQDERARAGDRVTALHQSGRSAAALTEAEAALSRAPDDERLRALHAALLLDHGRPEEALGELNPLIGEDPDHGGLHIAACAALLELGNGWEALRAATSATSLRPEEATAHEFLARAYDAVGLQDRAIEAAEKALELEAQSPERHLFLVQVLIPDGRKPPRRDLDRAQRLVLEALDLDPGNAWAVDALAQIRFLRGRHFAAFGASVRAVSHDPMNEGFRNRLLALMALHVKRTSDASLLTFLVWIVVVGVVGPGPVMTGILATAVATVLGVGVWTWMRQVPSSRRGHVRTLVRSWPFGAVWVGALVLWTVTAALLVLPMWTGPLLGVWSASMVTLAVIRVLVLVTW